MSGTIFALIMDHNEETEQDNLTNKIEKLEANILPFEIALNIVHEIAADIIVDPNLQLKIRDTIIHYNVIQSMQLSSNGITHEVLGLSTLQPPSFTYEEHATIDELMKERLDRYAKEVEIRGNTKKIGTITDKILFESRDSLQEVMKMYANNLLEYRKILQQMKTLRMKTLPEVCAGQLYETKVKNQMNNSKWHLIDHSLQTQIFAETDVSVDAYKGLLQDVQRQQEDRQMEVESLNELKIKYNLVDCKEYQAMLKEYLQYKDAIDKKLRFDRIMNHK